LALTQSEPEIAALKAELDEFRKETERIRQALGCVGGRAATAGDRIVNTAEFRLNALAKQIASIDERLPRQPGRRAGFRPARRAAV